MNLARERLGPGPANELLDRLIAGTHLELMHAPQADFNAAQAIFRQYPTLSFVDASIVAYMNRDEIDHLYSFDDGFDGVNGLTRLDTADNPFN